ncbi:MAG: hypothetical protein OQL06_05725 [Gammaproteobacteria bacterium]|nr:hypothetical protein [Gammaproteobacteria bacterium]
MSLRLLQITGDEGVHGRSWHSTFLDFLLLTALKQVWAGVIEAESGLFGY